jgi:hypothetical protein
VKHIHVGEVKVPVSLSIQAPWGNSDDQQTTIVLESSDEEDVGSTDLNLKERVIFIMSYFHFYLSSF